MPVALRAFPDAGVVALFDEPNQTGAVHDIDAPRNAPAKSPGDHLDKLYFHVALDMLEVASSASVNVSHAEIAAGSAASGAGGGTTIDGGAVLQYGGVTDDHLLYEHDLGYLPFVLVSQGDNILWPGLPVQTASGGRARYVTPYVTTTQVRLWETASRTSAALSATTLSYDLLVFRQPPPATGDQLINFDPESGLFRKGLDRFRTDRRYLQVAPGGSPLFLSQGRTIDLSNGAPRAVRGDGTTFEPVAIGSGFRLNPGTTVAGDLITYDGDFVGDGAVEVQAP